LDPADARPREAAERLQTVLRIRPDWWPAFERLGTALVRLGQNAEAIPWFEKALVERPEDPDALTGLGVALAESGRLEEAVQAWGRALRSGESGAHLHDNLARALRRLGRRAESRRHAAIARRLLGRGGFFGYLQDAWERLRGAVCE
jgi:Flp pilus assembly protein TadD